MFAVKDLEPFLKAIIQLLTLILIHVIWASPNGSRSFFILPYAKTRIFLVCNVQTRQIEMSKDVKQCKVKLITTSYSPSKGYLCLLC